MNGLEREGWDTGSAIAPCRVVVWATHSFVGFHCWPGAPEGRAYLADRHRHLFRVRVEVEVVHDDRDVEFHDLFDVIVAECAELAEAEGRSCEMLARRVRAAVLQEWPDRYVMCEVSEDGEFGAKVLPSDAA